jgi:O-antigen/teichoic acid export membrane protein
MAATASQAGERGWLILQRLVEAPLFLAFWGAHLWGEWLLLTACVQYLQLTNLGIGNAAQNEATIAVGSGETERACAALQTLHAALWVLGAAGTAVILALLVVVDPAQLLGLVRIDGAQSRLVIYAMLVQLILMMHIAVPYAALAAVGRYALASQLNLVLAVLVFLPVAILLPLDFAPATLALAMAAMTLLGYIVFWIVALRVTAWMSFGWRAASWTMLKRLWRPSLGMAAFNFGTLLNVQGFRIAAGLTLGPAALALLAVLRTFGQTLVQLGGIFTLSFRPELSAMHGRRDAASFQRLARMNVQFALWLALPLALLGIIGGQWVIGLWTSGRVEPSFIAVLLVLGATLLEVFWRNAMSPAVAINRHNRIALAYLLIFGALIVGLTIPLAKAFQEEGALLALLSGQALMMFAVLRFALPAYGETDVPSWLRAVAAPPFDLVLSAWRRDT